MIKALGHTKLGEVVILHHLMQLFNALPPSVPLPYKRVVGGLDLQHHEALVIMTKLDQIKNFLNQRNQAILVLNCL
jgi:hypothetical protein